jgi:hypothetical protein
MKYVQDNVYNVSSFCQICMKNAIYNSANAICECVNGYFMKDQECISIALFCKANETYNANIFKC